MNIYIIRHGLTVNNVLKITQPVDGNISILDSEYPKLREEAERLSSLFSEKPTKLKILFAQSLRAKQTSVPFVQKFNEKNLDFSHSQQPNLNEVNFGIYSNHDENFTYNNKTLRDYDSWIISKEGFTFPNGESLLDIKSRCIAIDKHLAFLKEQGYTDVLLVTHNRFLRHLYEHLGLCLPEQMFELKFPHSKVFHILDAAKTKPDVDMFQDAKL